jgi:hypothetical protein
MAVIENTSSRDPFTHFLGLLSDGQDKYITGMEAAGQSQFVTSAAMPKDSPWDQLEALGFVRGDAVAGDDLFVSATLPEGWSKQATDHSMWSKIVDQRGIERVSIFYKAAFYDRKAFSHLVHIGHQFARNAIWGDQPAKLPESWDLLTDDEKTSCAAALDEARADELEKRSWMADNPAGLDTIAQRVARIDAAKALLESAGVARQTTEAAAQ